MKIIKQVELENTDGHSKFWRGTLLADDTVICEWGKIGYEPSSKSFPGAGASFLEKKEAEKIKKGYQYV